MVFFGQFSPRPGTAAFKMKDNVSKKEKVGREKFLNEILKTTTLANNKKYIGKVVEVLIEKEKNGLYFGKTRTMKNVKLVSNKKKLLGKIVKVKISKANTWNLEVHTTKNK
jgi:tRNA A37 methylthiotransferase MiaB